MKKITTLSSSLFLCLLSLSGLQAQNGWTQVASLPGAGSARHHPVTWGIDDYGYVLTGTTNIATGTKDFYEYDAINDSWRTLANFPGTARGFSIGGMYQGEGYIGFGMTGSGVMLNDMWKYDPDTEVWTQLASCPCIGRRHPTFSVNEKHGKIYVGQGDNGQTNLRDWWEYDIASDTWTQRSNFPSFTRHHPYHFSIDDYTYSGLGHGASIYDDMHRYDPQTDNWTPIARAPEPRVAGAQFAHAGLGFVLSGDDRTHGATNPSIFWAYRPSADEWVSMPPHPGPSRWAPGSFVVNGVVYFMGGQDRTVNRLERDMWSFQLDVYLSEAELQPLAEQFQLFPNPTTGILNISTDLKTQKAQIKVYGIDGSVRLAQPYSESIDVQNLPTGVYILEIAEDNGASHRQRFIKS